MLSRSAERDDRFSLGLTSVGLVKRQNVISYPVRHMAETVARL